MLNYITKYFTLNRRERSGVFALITLILLLLLVKYFIVYHYQSKGPSVAVVQLDEVAARLAAEQMLGTNENDKNNHTSAYPAKERVKDSLFYFDPNTISVEQALQLGFDRKCAAMLQNYRNKGGKFYKASDLQKLYCMNEPLYHQLQNYIVIASERPQEGNGKNRKADKDKKDDPISIEINSADSITLMKLRGIGPGYARRILKYRSLLGGYFSVEQIKEVYNFPDSLYQSIKGNLTVDPALVQKIKVNNAEFKTLVHHPYIKYEGTKCIFALKRGKKIKEEDLVNSSCFDRETLKKVLVYLDFND